MKETGRRNTELETDGLFIGRNAVAELLKSGRSVDKIFVQRGEREGSITELVAKALDRRIPVIESERQKLDSLSGGAVHQGIVAMAAKKEYVDLDALPLLRLPVSRFAAVILSSLCLAWRRFLVFPKSGRAGKSGSCRNYLKNPCTNRIFYAILNRVTVSLDKPEFRDYRILGEWMKYEAKRISQAPQNG